jgi:hypothetical protein
MVNCRLFFTVLLCYACFNDVIKAKKGDLAMGDTGKKDKGKKEQKKKAKLTILEKRKQKHEKKHPTAGVL